jgi:hypothetical protein
MCILFLTDLFPIGPFTCSLCMEIVCAVLCSINQLRRYDDYCTFFSNVDKCQDYHKVRTSYINKLSEIITLV